MFRRGTKDGTNEFKTKPQEVDQRASFVNCSSSRKSISPSSTEHLVQNRRRSTLQPISRSSTRGTRMLRGHRLVSSIPQWRSGKYVDRKSLPIQLHKSEPRIAQIATPRRHETLRANRIGVKPSATSRSDYSDRRILEKPT